MKFKESKELYMLSVLEKTLNELQVYKKAMNKFLNEIEKKNSWGKNEIKNLIVKCLLKEED